LVVAIATPLSTPTLPVTVRLPLLLQPPKASKAVNEHSKVTTAARRRGVLDRIRLNRFSLQGVRGSPTA
jgi:hypothetical protein